MTSTGTSQVRSMTEADALIASGRCKMLRRGNVIVVQLDGLTLPGEIDVSRLDMKVESHAAGVKMLARLLITLALT